MPTHGQAAAMDKKEASEATSIVVSPRPSPALSPLAVGSPSRKRPRVEAEAVGLPANAPVKKAPRNETNTHLPAVADIISSSPPIPPAQPATGATAATSEASTSESDPEDASQLSSQAATSVATSSTTSPGSTVDDSPSVSSSAPRERRLKTLSQLVLLKNFYAVHPRVNKEQVRDIIEQTGLSHREVTRWFRNERHKVKKQREQEAAGAAHLAQYQLLPVPNMLLPEAEQTSSASHGSSASTSFPNSISGSMSSGACGLLPATSAYPPHPSMFVQQMQPSHFQSHMLHHTYVPPPNVPYPQPGPYPPMQPFMGGPNPGVYGQPQQYWPQHPPLPHMHFPQQLHMQTPAQPMFPNPSSMSSASAYCSAASASASAPMPPPPVSFSSACTTAAFTASLPPSASVSPLQQAKPHTSAFMTMPHSYPAHASVPLRTSHPHVQQQQQPPPQQQALQASQLDHPSVWAGTAPVPSVPPLPPSHPPLPSLPPTLAGGLQIPPHAHPASSASPATAHSPTAMPALTAAPTVVQASA